jgi:hypothetical protein
VLIPVIRTAATIGFAIAPYSLGFVVIAVSEQLVSKVVDLIERLPVGAFSREAHSYAK